MDMVACTAVKSLPETRRKAANRCKDSTVRYSGTKLGTRFTQQLYASLNMSGGYRSEHREQGMSIRDPMLEAQGDMNQDHVASVTGLTLSFA